jgi:hypothetical protein
MLAVLQTVVCRQLMTKNLESVTGCLLLLQWGESAYRIFLGGGGAAEGLLGTLGKYVVTELSMEVECCVICVGGK